MRELFDDIVAAAGRVVLGKERVIRLALACLLADGHLLIEDIPGIGKTTLAQTLARVLGLSFRRVQFTSDMLPGDILGVAVYEQERGEFVYHPGPVFTQVLLADEINRATPKTQSALLEAMEERQVSAEGVTRPLPEPFFVIATQNPVEQSGTFPLPDSQLDRFLLRVSLGYPDRAAEMRLLSQGDARQRAAGMEAQLTADKVLDLQRKAAALHTAQPLLEYVLDLVDFTRTAPEFLVGLSPRAGLSLLAAARAWAFIHGREMATPDDVQAVLLPVVGHRIRGSRDRREIPPDVLGDLFARVPIP